MSAFLAQYGIIVINLLRCHVLSERNGLETLDRLIARAKSRTILVWLLWPHHRIHVVKDGVLGWKFKVSRN